MWRTAMAVNLSMALAWAVQAPSGGLRRYETPYYIIHTDLPPDGAAEAVVRMARLGEDLGRRTRALGFGGRIDRRMPFFLYSRHADYVAAAKAPPASAGMFRGDRLVAAAADARGNAAWHVVQHEAFHQFAAAAPGTPPPPWIDEGFGEYFGEALFTGDGYVAGIVPAWRVVRVRQAILDDAFLPLGTFAGLSQDDWNRDMRIARYDQAWSLIQFLLHADGGAYKGRVVTFMKSLGGGVSAAEAWRDAFGDWDDLEARWRRYWIGLPDDGTPRAKAEAMVATITSFLARAVASGQTFESFDSFAKAARSGTLRLPQRDWLPTSLLLRALDDASKANVRCQLTGAGEMTRLAARLPNGGNVVGRFKLEDGRVAKVEALNPEP